jgi:hypothetical protein
VASLRTSRPRVNASLRDSVSRLTWVKPLRRSTSHSAQSIEKRGAHGIFETNRHWSTTTPLCVSSPS